MAFETPSCERCLAERLRSRITRAIRPPAPGRLERLVRRTSLAVAAGVIASVPLAGLPVTPPAEARSVIPMPQVQLPVREPGYKLVTANGDVLPFGTAAGADAPDDRRVRMTGIARTPSGNGSWTVSADGGVFTTGDAPFKGSLGGVRLNQPIVGIAATPTGGGYWLASADGGVFAFGDAKFHGGAAAEPLNGRITAIAAMPTGKGYWLASSDGGVFAFGDASFRGAAAGQHLNAPIVAMAPTRTGRGYRLVSADGGVFAFGDATFHGAVAGKPMSGTIVGIVPSRTDEGYWLASSDGGVFTFGDAPFLGSSGGNAGVKVVGIAGGLAHPRPKPAPAPVEPKVEPAVAPAAAPVATPAITTPAPLAAGKLKHRFGYDISWPQCEGPFPVAGYGFMVIGVTGGRPFTENRCLDYEWKLANSHGGVGSLYVNVASPKFGDPASMNGPAGACAGHDLPCQTYNHSANNIEEAIRYAKSVGANAPMWWIDVEVLNRWSSNQALNALTVKAAKETLEKAGIRPGVYSTWLQWRKITGDAEFGMPVWAAGVPSDAEMPGYCNRPEKAFNAGEIWMVQSIPIQFDVNYVCDPMVPHVGGAFAFPAEAPAAPAADKDDKVKKAAKGDAKAEAKAAKVSTKPAASDGKPSSAKPGKPDAKPKKKD